MNPTGPIVLFDGVCNLCNGTVNLLLDLDRKRVLRFASLQSEYAKKLVSDNGLESQVEAVDSILVWDGKGLFSKSDAVLRITGYLGWPWKIFRLGIILPGRIRDSLYDFIAKNRYKWFGKTEACRMPTPELKERILG
ncbi:thiol-disulfide oxidoreductase DCC family protein [Leptospira wolffii]|uniref:thiol-disulfide oxidoreductase DCC family protein n=1 Tax=Leptospira wolffii TaxID=409998 RepID=UPI0002F5C02D|nr:thiol-disulfide oxidoreductase DCC family protein [Leptospira wolffii]EPG66670.1 PF04134 family protein [Leptospira wolffii serovar Khorat str. Khorat-H2]